VDFRAVHSGYISVTPLHLDLTNYKLLENIRSWNLKL
jgi:5'-nucleotidase